MHRVDRAIEKSFDLSHGLSMPTNGEITGSCAVPGGNWIVVVLMSSLRRLRGRLRQERIGTPWSSAQKRLRGRKRGFSRTAP